MKTLRSTPPEIGAKSTRPTRPPPKRTTPIPSAKFQRQQRKLQRLLDPSGSADCTTPEGLEAWKQRGKRRAVVEASLRDEFKAAFGLTGDAYGRTKRLLWRLTDHDYPHPLFDHVSCYQRGSNQFIVSQPYGVDEVKLQRWCRENGAVAHGIIKEWAHYYPGHATCLFIEFAPRAPCQRRTRRSR